jgi:hypothetical protein
MRLLSIQSSPLLLTAATVNSAMWAQNATSRKPVPVELWHTGDDGYSQRLTVTMEKTFTRAPEFVSSSGKKPGTLIIRIPENLDWEKIENRIRIHYKVEYSWIDRPTQDMSVGSCWDDEFSKCAAQILEGAREMVRKAR